MNIIDNTVKPIIIIFFLISVTSDIGDSFLSILKIRYNLKIRNTLITLMTPKAWVKKLVDLLSTGFYKKKKLVHKKSTKFVPQHKEQKLEVL